MSTVIPRFAERAAPLYEIFEAAYKKNGKRTKRAIARMSLQSLGWGKKHSEAFSGLQEQLQDVVKSAYRDPSMHICVHSDASDEFWAAEVTQCHASELEKDTTEQRHGPIAFVSIPFSGAKEN